MLDIGLLGLDTSHPGAFADLLAARDDATVAAVWDGGDVRDAAYAEEFCDRHGATLYAAPSAMVDAVDAAMVLTANWDTHRELAVPFLDAGVPTLIDKPLAGRIDDVDAIAAAAEGTPLFGGSAVPFHPDLAALPTGVPDRALYAAGYGDPFYYGVHVVDAARLLAGADWTAVAPADDPGIAVAVDFANGARATLRLDGPEDDAAFAFLDVAERVSTIRIGSDEAELDRLYRGFVDAFLDAARGERDDTDRLVDSARLLLAVRAALDAGGRVTPDDDRLGDVHADGAAFLADYEP